tara:strand:+ start:16799 stop:17791 length:993 start_codon:yes stop_codon:yes gene_type:complete
MNSEEQQEELNEEQAPEQPIENGPGHLLVKKREALGMSVQEVADALHITMHYVRALETDAHDKLPGDVFIKGYLRSYAGLLQLDPTVIINVYSEYNSERANAEEYGARRRSSVKRRIPWLVVSGVAFVGMAIALWYFNSGSSSTAGAAAAPAAGNVGSRTIRPGGGATLDQVATSVVVPSVPEQLAAPDSSPQPVSTELEEQAMPEIVPSQDVPMPVQLTPDAEQIEEQADTPVASEASEQRLISVDGDGEDLVQFTFTGESMVQVTDANDEQLYRDVRVAGDLLRISGTAPFNILLGDASNSELSFNGAEVDFSSSIRIDNSARLTIGL